MNDADYESSLSYLYGLEKFGSVFGLGNISGLLGSIGDPHRSLRTVHIAGTNGKGSVAAMLSHILKAAGYRVGKYTSPHLVSFTERITVNEKEISGKDVALLTAYIRRRAEKARPHGFYTFFDFTTAMALEYFRRKRVDIAILETGLGGRLDSTNIVEPVATIITNVAFDHMRELGRTISRIAREKAGIIKAGVPVITGARGRALTVLKDRAAELSSSVYVLGKDFSFRKTGEGRMAFRGTTRTCDDVTVNLSGDHQLSNAALALCAAEVLGSAGFTVGEKAIKKGLGSVRWQGRLETVRQRPLVILDGAHNLSGARALRRFICSRYSDRKKVLVFGVMRDKEYRKMLATMSDCFDVTILTRPKIDRALDPERMKGFVRKPIIAEDTRSALNAARRYAGEKDLILVTGSIYTIGEAKQAVHELF